MKAGSERKEGEREREGSVSCQLQKLPNCEEHSFLNEVTTASHGVPYSSDLIKC